MGSFYVYRWIRPDTGDVFYVGKGNGARDVQYKKHSKFFMRIVDKLKRNGLDPIIERIGEGLTEVEAFNLERSEISTHGRRSNGTGTLVNLTDGGEGASGLVHSEETKAKISAALVGKMAGIAGHPQSEETRKKIADAKRGKPRSEETRAKLSAAGLGKTLSQETKAKMSGVRLGRPRSEGVRAKLRSVNLEARPRRTNSSGYKGVAPQDGKWRVQVRVGEKRKHIGMFSTAEDAARAYDKAAIAAWGLGNCYLNFPDEVAQC